MKNSILLFSALLLNSCTLITRLIGADVCKNEGSIECKRNTAEFCEGGLTTRIDCDATETCVEGVGCEQIIVCGDGAINIGEECDGANLNGETCDTATNGANPLGVLSCNANCTLNATSCLPETCGDGLIDPGEECDSNNLNGETCGSATNGAEPLGAISCNADCSLNISACQPNNNCGNNTIDVGEECDGNNLNGETCDTATNGVNPLGVLACNSDCTINDTNCLPNTCGDGIANNGEECDGNSFSGDCAVATNNALPQGVIACNADCTFNTNECSRCGDQIVQANEECDDGCPNGGAGCAAVDDGDGCSSICTLEVSSSCNNNGNIQGSEICDGNNFANTFPDTCQEFGFTNGGVILCSNCNPDTSQCIP
jgi:hypothetical protein